MSGPRRTTADWNREHPAAVKRAQAKYAQAHPERKRESKRAWLDRAIEARGAKAARVKGRRASE